MNVLVVSRISIPATETTIPAWQYLRNLGHNVYVCHPHSTDLGVRPSHKINIDVIISMGVTVMAETFLASKRYPNAKLMCYQWDCYAWIWEPGLGGKRQAKHKSRPREYDYITYGKLLKYATEVWVPSNCTGLRTEQWWGIDNWHTILSSIPYWGYDDVQDKGYALCCLREIPDPCWGVLERTCESLGIVLHMPKHELSYQEYQREVAHCSFLVAPLYELSTGGLSLLEGYYHGKPVLLSDSEWNGGRDYLGGRATYFKHGDEEDLKNKLLYMMEHRRETREPLADGQDWVRTNYSDNVMIDKMLERINKYV